MSAFFSRNRKAGQGMTEYIVIVALIAVAAIATYQFFGQTIRNQTAGIAREVAGQDSSASRQAAAQSSDGAVGEGTVKGLDNYQNDAARGGR